MRAILLVALFSFPTLAANPEATFNPMPRRGGPSFTVKINGTLVYPGTAASRVRLKAVDQVEVKLNGKTTALLAKFIAGATYDVRDNACSLWEIAPRDGPSELPKLTVAVEAGAKGPVLFDGFNEPTAVEAGEEKTVEVGRSAMCPYSSLNITAEKDGVKRSSAMLLFHGSSARATYRRDGSLQLEFAK